MSVAEMTREDRECRLADAERRQAARTIAGVSHKLGIGASCPCCGHPAVIGKAVRVMHAVSCARRAVMTAARKAAAGGRITHPAPAPVPAAAIPVLDRSAGIPERPALLDDPRRHPRRQRAWAAAGCLYDAARGLATDGSVPLSALAGRLVADGGGYSARAVVLAVRALRNAGAVSVEGTGPRAVVSLARAQDDQAVGGVRDGRTTSRQEPVMAGESGSRLDAFRYRSGTGSASPACPRGLALGGGQ